MVHAVRDPARHGAEVRGVPRAGVLLTRRPTARGTPRRAPAEWWAEYFDEGYLLEFEPLFDPVVDRQQVVRLLDILGLPDGARVLDCPCGQGRHAHLLAESGLSVDGLDYSSSLLARAKARGTDRQRLRYTRGDMRRLPVRWTGRFDAVLNLFTSFGFFLDPRDDRQVLAEFARVLRPGGRLVWHGGSRDGVMARFLAKDWWVVGDGTVVTQERRFDPLSGILTITSTFSGGPRSLPPREHRIRLYTASELAGLMRDVGLVVESAEDAWSGRPLRRTSSEMLLVARKE